MTKTARDILKSAYYRGLDKTGYSDAELESDLKELEAIHQQEIAKASSDITANQLLNHIADGMGYDKTFTYTELEEALEIIKKHKEK